jgi:hypothetical protein
MSGGAKISGNTGGGVDVSSGSFTMSGGEISGNTGGLGGGVYVSSGSFTMSGGEISGNTDSSSGGGVYVSGGGSFTMSGGEISGNTASSGLSGGGVFVWGGSFEMSGGEISGNTSSSGGGVYVNEGTFTKTALGGVVYGSDAPEGLRNNAGGNGDAVYNYNGGKSRNRTIGASEAFDAASDDPGQWD